MTQSDYFPLDYKGERGVRKIFDVRTLLLGSELGEMTTKVFIIINTTNSFWAVITPSHLLRVIYTI